MSEQETVSNIIGPVRQLPPGEQLAGAQGVYTVEKYLGLGLTAQVYRARRESDGALAALKVLRADASPVSTEHFWHEAQILSELRAAGVTATPAVLDQQRQGDIRFLAIEYLDRAVFKPLDELLETEPLPEAQALEIARQALVVLDRLHTQVGRTYTDMQLKNFWWDADSEPPTLKILDWNHVSTQQKDIQPDELLSFGIVMPDNPTDNQREVAFAALAQRDLGRFGAYFYRILTGKGADERGEPGGLTGGLLARRAGATWEMLSVAVRQVVLRALHPDPTKRYQTAKEFLAAVAEVQTLWKVDNINQIAVRQAYQDAEKAMPDESGEAKRLQLTQTWRDLDMLERCHISVPARYRERLLPLLTPGFTGVWSSGKLYYETRQYLSALTKWEPEAEAQQRAVLWRWVRLAQTSAAHPDRFLAAQGDLEALIETLSGVSVDFAAAQQQWTQIAAQHPWAPEAPIGVLGQEVLVAQLIQDGRDAEATDEWAKAVDAYSHANAVLKTIAYGDLLREEWGWQGLAEWIKEAAAKRDALHLDTAQTEELRAAFAENAAKGLGLLKVRLSVLPENMPLLGFSLAYARELSATAGTVSAPEDEFVVGAEAPPEAETGLEVGSPALPEHMRSVVSASALALLETALNILDTALLWGNVPALRDDVLAERERIYTTLRRQRIAEVFEPLAARLRTAVENRDGEQIQAVTARIAADPLLRESTDYQALVEAVQTAYQYDIAAGWLADASRLLEALRDLDPKNDAARREVWRTEVEALKTCLVELREKKEAAKRQLEEEQAKNEQILRAKEAEVKKALADMQDRITQAKGATEKLLTFQQWARELNAEWQKSEQQAGPDYADLIKQADAALETARSEYEAVMHETAFKGWESYVARRKADWQKREEERRRRQETFQQQERTLEEVAQALKKAREDLGQLTPDSLSEAGTQLTDAKAGLGFDPLSELQPRHAELTMHHTKLVEVKQYAETNLLPAVAELREKMAILKDHLDKEAESAQVEAAVRDVLHAVPTAQRRAWEVYWLENSSSKVTLSYPALDKIAREAVQFENALFPTSAIEQELLDLLNMALIALKTEIEQKLNEQQESLAAMPDKVAGAISLLPPTPAPIDTRRETGSIISWLEARLPSDLPKRVGELSEKLDAVQPDKMEEIMKRESRKSRWWGIGVAVLLALLLFLGMGMLGVGLGWQWPFGTTPTPEATTTITEPQTSTVTPTVSTTPTSTPEVKETATIAVTSQAEDTSPTEIPTPTPTPTPTLTSDISISWTHGVTLYDMPPLTLTAQAGWTLTLTASLSNTKPIILQSIDLTETQESWSVDIVVTDTNNGRSVPVTGTWALSDTTVAIWQPATPVLRYAGDYRVAFRITNDEGVSTDIHEQSLQIDQRYDAMIATVQVIDPGVPGMIGVHTITNTGNVEDVIWLSIMPLKPSEIISIEVVYTSTEEIPQKTIFPSTTLDNWPTPITVTYQNEPYTLVHSYTLPLPLLPPGIGMQLRTFVHPIPNKLSDSLYILICNDGKATPIVYYEGFK